MVAHRPRLIVVTRFLRAGTSLYPVVRSCFLVLRDPRGSAEPRLRLRRL